MEKEEGLKKPKNKGGRPKAKTPLTKHHTFRLSIEESNKLELLYRNSDKGSKADVVRHLIMKSSPLKPMAPLQPIFDKQAVMKMSQIHHDMNKLHQLIKDNIDGITLSDTMKVGILNRLKDMDNGLLRMLIAVSEGKESTEVLANEGIRLLAQQPS